MDLNHSETSSQSVKPRPAQRRINRQVTHHEIPGIADPVALDAMREELVEAGCDGCCAYPHQEVLKHPYMKNSP